MKTLLATLITIVSFSIVVEGQEFTKLLEKTRSSIEKKWPDWKLISKDEREKEAVYNWGSVRFDVRILVFFGKSKDEAIKRMEADNWSISVGPGRKWTDLGDEAYMLVNSRSDFTRLRFRKANVYIDIQANSVAGAEELARSVEKLIKKGGR